MDALPYFRFVASAVLLDTHSLSAGQMGAWIRIWAWLQRESPPGLMAPMDLDRLACWSSMDASEWQRDRLAVLGMFLFHAPTASLHDPGLQAQYLATAGIASEISVKRRDAALRRWGRKIGPPPGRVEIPSPYARFKAPFLHFSAQSWPEIENALEKQRLMHLQCTVDARASIITITTSTAPGPALLGAGPEPDVQAWLNQQSDSALAELKRRYLAQAPEFVQRHYALMNPRSSLHFASSLCLFAERTPPAAEAAGA